MYDLRTKIFQKFSFWIKIFWKFFGWKFSKILKSKLSEIFFLNENFLKKFLENFWKLKNDYKTEKQLCIRSEWKRKFERVDFHRNDSLPTIAQKNVVNKNLNPDESAVDLIRFSTTEKQKYFSYLGLKWT